MGNQRPIAVDLFAGVGGMTLGFEQAGFDVLAAVEIDPIHCATHEYNFPEWSAICASVTEISGDNIRTRSTIGDREVDVVFGGPPCQGFSLMGKRAFDDPRNQLVSHFMRLVIELNAKYFVMENVKGLTLGKHRQFLDEVIESFNQQGYKVLKEYRVLNASHFGIPQHRERLFLIGCRQDLALPNYPSPITKPAKAKRIPKELVNLSDSPTVKEAIADLPDISQYPELRDRDWCVADYKTPQSTYAKYLRGLQIEPHNLSYPRIYNTQILTSSIGVLHNDKTIARFRLTANGEIEKVSRFLKLDPEGICNTLRAGTPSNRGAFTAPRPIHPYQPRCITVREAARIHSYPDWFRFHSTKWHGFRQIGNSVPPLLARAVARQLIEVIGANPRIPEQTIYLGNEHLLQMKMIEAAKKYAVSSHVIAPRVKNCYSTFAN
ncbi:DNA cytosine methyltransferase [Pseudanabaena sp. FACHB-1998]|uniref:DNA cytosine methyltransferase n=1 Tax=Pseudanabaena sp. FACHB-1998 TaxID=2692858 RepID=UPI0016818663|nr:DNA cytosine methyltransferase [Pseudanabaena sp. FACHB-1998]MBD2175713.1 DNA cytosine methyltransferase [Pseudanabaena sp. FACHB-1998]